MSSVAAFMHFSAPNLSFSPAGRTDCGVLRSGTSHTADSSRRSPSRRNENAMVVLYSFFFDSVFPALARNRWVESQTSLSEALAPQIGVTPSERSSEGKTTTKLVKMALKSRTAKENDVLVFGRLTPERSSNIGDQSPSYRFGWPHASKPPSKTSMRPG